MHVRHIRSHHHLRLLRTGALQKPKHTNPYVRARTAPFHTEATFPARARWPLLDTSEGDAVRSPVQTVRRPPKTSQHAGPYTYSPIPQTGAIRLLKLLPDTESTRGQVHCALEVFDVNRLPEYIALSYTWGPPEAVADADLETSTRTRPIFVNGQSLKATENLLQGLLEIKASNATDEWFWIDAVCINQEDRREKNSQVSQMGMIYHNAQCVLVWVGNDVRHEATLVDEMIHKLAERGQTLPRPFPQCRNYRHLLDADYLDQLGLPRWGEDEWISLGLFLSRRWFRRIWCAQEIMLAQGNTPVAVVLFGSTAIPWAKVAVASMFMLETGLSKTLANLLKNRIKTREVSVIVPEGQIGLGAAGLTLLSEQLKNGSDHGRSAGIQEVITAAAPPLSAAEILLWLLCIVPNREASDPRDRIYGLLGAVNHFAKLKGNQISSIVPDYGKSVQQVYEEATQTIIEGVGSLDVLSCLRSSDQNDIPEIASWACCVSGLGWKPFLHEPIYNASLSGSMKPYDFHFSGRKLHTRGMRVGLIDAVSETGEQINMDGSITEALRVILGISLIGRNGQTRVEMFWRTLIADMCPIAKFTVPAPKELSQQFKIWLMYVIARGKLLDIHYGLEEASFNETLKLLDELAATDTTHVICTANEISGLLDKCGAGKDPFERCEQRLIELLPRLADSWTNVENVLPHRRLFRTSRGDLGMGPSSMKPGDCVMIVSGSRMPFTLRRSESVQGENSFVLLGETYVHGIMQGEALQGGSEWEPITIM